MNIKQYSTNKITIEVTDQQNDIINIKDIKSVLFSATGSKAIAPIECIEHYDTSTGTLGLPLSAADRDTLGAYNAKIELISDNEHYIATTSFIITPENIPEIKVTIGTTPTINIDIEGEKPEGKIAAAFMTSQLSKRSLIKGTAKLIKDVLKVKLAKADTEVPGERFLSIKIGAEQATLIKLVVV